MTLGAYLRLGNENSIRIGLLVGLEALLIRLAWQLEGLRDEVEASRVTIDAEAHSACKDVFVGQALDVWETIGDFGRARVDPLEDFRVGHVPMHPS